MGEYSDPDSSELEFFKIETVTPSPDDWETLRRLKLQSLDEEPVAFQDPDAGRERYEQRTEEEWRQILDGHLLKPYKGECETVFSRNGADYTGMVQAYMFDTPGENGKEADIKHFYVAKEARGRGVGRELLTAILRKLSTHEDINSIQLSVLSTQETAINLYESMGFKKTGIEREAVSRGNKKYDVITMKYRPEENK